jgi:hypothetical protein
MDTERPNGCSRCLLTAWNGRPIRDILIYDELEGEWICRNCAFAGVPPELADLMDGDEGGEQ